MKSITMMPPMSRSRSCRTISSAASRLLLVTVASRLPPVPVNLPVLTSITVIASVRSMIKRPAGGQKHLALQAFRNLLVQPVLSEKIIVTLPAAQPILQVRRDVRRRMPPLSRTRQSSRRCQR